MAPPDGTLVAQLVQEMRGRIAARTLAPGTRLLSIRAQATARGISKTTVVEAYDRLAAEGVIESRRGSGFYVAGHPPPFSLAETGPKLDRDMDPLWVSRQSLEMPDNALKPGCGWLPPSWMPEASLRRALRGLARADAAALTDYGSPRGFAPLREHLARRLGSFGVPAAPGQILLVDSGTQAVDLLCRFLLEPGDTVLVDDPCYFNFRALLRAHRARVVSVPYTPAGPDIAAFGQVLEDQKPRLYITNCAVHNPTGASLSPVTAHRLLKLAEQHGLTIIEDDIFADFEAEPSPRLAAFDGLERVVQVGSFSKTVSASLRCGYIAVKSDWIEGLTDLKIASSFSSGRLSAELLLAVLQDGSYRKHIETLRAKLAGAMSQASTRLRAIGLTPWVMPRAGMYLWCELPARLDAAEIARRALEDGIVLAPGNVFSPAQTAGRFLRFNVAQCADPRIFQMLNRAMAAPR
ncbi:PLP-dependent aminotransferase family protein [Acidocella sp. KAb 2-4]|uniref:aminotransferase-like domain-containing protein n=1 Tax=Acidocella sp. KAb 2-4 TaxID=2885158 RepID=UPI001D088C13|nr:PLP-dependent aminotransferase family protein [Acidocella sp. KAb 2-4]MCB5943950.1 PLP-dependent aminotransferase family protein [Acidocella sp. KAb 2-4]